MWMLNELSSPYGDTDQKLAADFLQALTVSDIAVSLLVILTIHGDDEDSYQKAPQQ